MQLKGKHPTRVQTSDNPFLPLFISSPTILLLEGTVFYHLIIFKLNLKELNLHTIQITETTLRVRHLGPRAERQTGDLDP